MKYLVMTLVVLVAVGCSSSNISLTANIPESQEVDIHIQTKNNNKIIVYLFLKYEGILSNI